MTDPQPYDQPLPLAGLEPIIEDARIRYADTLNSLAAYDAGQPVARRTDPDTSWDAARSVRNITEVHRGILDVLTALGPATDEMIADAWPRHPSPGYPAVSPSGLRTRRRELCDAGHVTQALDENGDVAKTTLRSGRSAILWTLTNARRT